MALKAGYVGVKRWLYEKLQATTAKNVKDIADIWDINTITGVHNILDSKAVTDDNFTVNADKSVSTNTTFSTRTVYYIRTKETNFAPTAGNYIASVSATATKLFMVVDAYNGTTWVKNLAKTATSVSFSIDYVGYDRIAVYLLVEDVPAVINATFYPMIRLAEDPDATYAPYAMTNQELTKNVRVSDGLSSVTVAANATLSTGDSYLKRQGALINMMLRVNSVTVSGSGTIATIPEGFRPPVAMPVFLTNASTGEYIPAFCTNSGLICPRSAVTSLNVNIYATWYTSAATLNRSLDAAPDTREASPEVIADDPEPVTKTTRKSTKKEDN